MQWWFRRSDLVRERDKQEMVVVLVGEKERDELTDDLQPQQQSLPPSGRGDGECERPRDELG